MTAVVALVLLAGAAAEPVCGAAPREQARRELLEELNEARRGAGREAVVDHPALCEIAAWRVSQVRETGDPSAGIPVVNEITRRLFRGGYRPHAWIQSALIGDPLAGRLAQWRAVRPDWYREAVEGDFEHAGVGIGTRFGQPVLALVLALPRCTVDRRRAAPLAELAAVRREALAAVNRHRDEAGLPPVEPDSLLDRAAQLHAEDMAARRYYSHKSPESTGPKKRAAAAGFAAAGSVGENIAKGIFTPTEVVDRWMNSSGHRGNILRARATRTGFGVAVGETPERAECVEAVWVQLLAGG